jgi:diguanylate cyclase (GGDEF)-like protein/PAS domain S-box-containing protein
MPNVLGGMHSNTQVTRKFAVGVAMLMAALLVIATVALIAIAYKQNVAQVALNKTAIVRSVGSELRSVGATVKDYAFWNDAYTYAGRNTIDLDWAFERDNMGASLFNRYSIEGVFIISSTQDTYYSVIRGELSQTTANQFVSGNLKPLLQAARERAVDDEAAYGYYIVDGLPALIYAAAIKPDDMTDEDALSDTSVMMFVDILDIDAIGLISEVRGLHLIHGLSDDLPSVSVQSDFGTKLRFGWTPTRPGDAFLITLLPLLVLTVAVFALLLWVLQRRMLHASALFDASQVALRVSEERFRSVAESSSDWIWEADRKGRLTFISERFSIMTGLPIAHWLGKSLSDLLGVDCVTLCSGANPARNAAARRQIECAYIDSRGHNRHCMLSVRPIFHDDEICGYRGTVTDVTEEVEAKRRIKHMSQHDALTGLANRSYLYAYLQAKLEDPSRPICLLSLDLDRFKPVNDTLGHSIGDQVLCEIALRLKQCVRPGDLVARLGGDEFVMVIDDLPQGEYLDQLCARICNAIGKPISSGEHELSLGVSIGVAIAPQDAGHAGDLLRYADIALYEAKAAGRNNWQFYAVEMNERVLERRQIETDLRNALRRSELFLEFQPRFTVDQTNLSGAEALVRWQHPVRGRLMPAHFIAIAEETGLIIALSDWVLHSACKAASEWRGDLMVSVNLSPVEFQRGDLVARVRDALESTGLAPGRLELEITETVMLEDAASALHIMNDLKRLGVRLSMDDFGTGYSSLSYLRAYPFDGIKIDRSFIADLHGDTKGTAIAIIESIIGLGRALTMTVTAEGVEHDSQLNDLVSVSCDEAQGYYLGRPQSLEQFKALTGSGTEGAAVLLQVSLDEA